MSKVKVIIAVLVSVLALSAVVSSAASADWMVNGTKLASTAALATSAAVMETGKLKFSETTIECTGATLNGSSPQIEAPDKGSAASLTFTECGTVVGSTCKITGEPISIGTVPITATVTLSGTLGANAVFVPKTKNTFATIKFEGCAIAGVQPVKGKATVNAPTGQMEQTLQEIVAATGPSELEVGTAAATLLGKALLRLVSGLPWSFL